MRWKNMHWISALFHRSGCGSFLCNCARCVSVGTSSNFKCSLQPSLLFCFSFSTQPVLKSTFFFYVVFIQITCSIIMATALIVDCLWPLLKKHIVNQWECITALLDSLTFYPTLDPCSLWNGICNNFPSSWPMSTAALSNCLHLFLCINWLLLLWVRAYW